MIHIAVRNHQFQIFNLMDASRMKSIRSSWGITIWWNLQRELWYIRIGYKFHWLCFLGLRKSTMHERPEGGKLVKLVCNKLPEVTGLYFLHTCFALTGCVGSDYNWFHWQNSYSWYNFFMNFRGRAWTWSSFRPSKWDMDDPKPRVSWG